MEILDLKVSKVTVPFKGTFRWRFGLRKEVNCIILQLLTDEGIIGVGEADYLGEWMVNIIEHHLKPLLLREDPFDIEKIIRKIYASGYIYWLDAVVYPLCAIEMALWDIIGKSSKRPISKLLGGQLRDKVECIAYLGYISPKEVKTLAIDFRNQGFRTFKIKVGIDPREDIQIVATLRDILGDEIEIRVDANQAWTLNRALRQLKKLEKYDIQYVEQPLPRWDIKGLRELRKRVSIPIAVCEGNYTIYDTLKIIENKAADIILIDPKRAGGLWAFKKACAIAEAADIMVGNHSGAEVGIATAAKLHLAASTPNFKYAMDSLYHWLNDDIIKEKLQYDKGTIKLPEKPGIGVTIDEEKLKNYENIFYSKERKFALWGLEEPPWSREIPSY